MSPLLIIGIVLVVIALLGFGGIVSALRSAAWLVLVIAIVVTSLLRHRIGARAWRVVHWLAYLCWPVALLHGLGTGSDCVLITSGPPKTTKKTKATFSFTANEEVQRFQCKLDAAKWRSCTSPTTYTKLSRKKHTFSVRATDLLGAPTVFLLGGIGTILLVLTMLLTQPMSNAAAALVVLPVAMSTAQRLGLDVVVTGRTGLGTLNHTLLTLRDQSGALRAEFEGATHSEAAWATRVGPMLQFLFPA